MKVRSDFVTNSSSSSFILEIGVGLTDGREILFQATGFEEEAGFYFTKDEEVDFDSMSDEEFQNIVDGLEEEEYYGDNYYFLGVNKSPKQLGKAETIPQLVKMLKNCIVNDDYCEGDEVPLVLRNPKDMSAANFIREISKLNSMDDIETIYISGDEMNYMSYTRCYTYNLKTGEYTGSVDGCEFEKDGGSGGDLMFRDVREATIEE